MVDGAQAAGERGDRPVVGDVDDLGADAGIVIGTGQFGLVSPGDDDSGSL